MSNAGAVIYDCLQVDPELVGKLKEVGITVDTVKEVLKQAFEEVRARAWEAGKQERSEEIAAEMIRGNETVTKIRRYTGLSMERIASIAKSLGVTSLAV